MKIVLDNDIRVFNPTLKIADYCRRNLSIDNPDFYKKQALGKWTGNTPAEIRLYEVIGNEIRIPFGRLRDIWALYPDITLYEAKFASFKPLNYESSINLYDYQKEAVIASQRAKNGILVMPCGAGKTQCGLELISRIGGKALWLTHTGDLLHQSLERARSVLNIEGKWGTITAGKINVGEYITFATVQTMCKIDLLELKDYWDIIIVDECQRCAGSPTKVTQFYKVLSRLSARYKYGLTATPKRADGLEKSMFALLGDVIHEVDKQAVKDTTCEVKVYEIHTGYTPDYNAVLLGDGTIDYNALTNDLIHDFDRFEKVFNVIDSLDGPALVLANRVEYLNNLNNCYNGRGICLSNMKANKKDKQKRKDALKKLNDGELDCIFATYQLAKEGLDVPNLRYVVFATPEKDETTVIQSVGRVGRKAEGKEYGTVIDFIDDFAMYYGWSKKRRGYYKKLEAVVTEAVTKK